MKTIIISNNIYLAKNAHDLGIDFVMVDLESEGKVERQKSRNTFISSHTWSDVEAVSRIISDKVNFMVRLNPCSERSLKELEKLSQTNATHVMQPMIRTAQDVETFLGYMNKVKAKFKLLPLIEHIDGLKALPEILKNTPDMKRVFFGLNDMSLSLKLPFLFQCITEGYMDEAAEVCKAGNVAFGFGGVGLMGQDVAVSPELIIAEHARLGSDSVILSRAFGGHFKFLDSTDGEPTETELDGFKLEVQKIKTKWTEFKSAEAEILKANHLSTKNAVETFLASKL